MDKQSRKKGLLLSLIVIVLWGLQPFFMKLALLNFDAYFISAFRLIFAAAIIFLFYLDKNGANLTNTFKRYWLHLSTAGFLIGINYYTFLKSVELGGTLTATVLIQTGPLLLLLIGVFFFRESFSSIQSLAGLLAALGFYLFFSERVSSSGTSALQIDAALFVLVAAVTWALFCVIQKSIGPKSGIALLNFASFLIAGVMLLPMVDLSQIREWQNIAFASVLFLTISAVLAYNALGEALKILPASSVSMLIATNPFVTLFFVEAFYLFNFTFFEPLPLSGLGYLGAFLAIIGVGVAVSKK